MPAQAGPAAGAPGAGLPQPLTAPTGLTPQSLAQILSNPWLPDLAKSTVMQMVQSRMAPQTMDVEGGKLMYNMAGQKVFIPEPRISKMKIGGLEFDAISHFNPQTGQWRTEPMTPGGGVPGAGANGVQPDLSSVGGMMATEAGQRGREAASAEAGKTAGGVQGTIDAEANDALGLKRNVAEMRNLGANINFNKLAEAKAFVGNVLQGVGFSNEAVTNFLGTNPGDVEGFRKAATVLAGQATSTTFPRATQNEFQIFLRNATPNELLSPQGMSRVMDFVEKGANIALEKQDAFQDWKRGKSPESYNDFNAFWNKQMREKIAKGEYTTQPGQVGGPQSQRGQPSTATPAPGQQQMPDPLGLRGGR